MNLSGTEAKWLADFIDTHGTITVRIQALFEDYIYIEPQVIITSNNIDNINLASKLIRKVIRKRPMVLRYRTRRIVVHGWRRCSELLEKLQPHLRLKRRHVDCVLRLAEIRNKIGAKRLLRNPVALDLTQQLVELNRRHDRRTLLDIVIANALSRF